LYHAERLPAKRQQSGTPPVGKETEEENQEKG
jgi:hypothetical protein